jgi:hypothetical protein
MGYCLARVTGLRSILDLAAWSAKRRGFLERDRHQPVEHHADFPLPILLTNKNITEVGAL